MQLATYRKTEWIGPQVNVLLEMRGENQAILLLKIDDFVPQWDTNPQSHNWCDLY